MACTRGKYWSPPPLVLLLLVHVMILANVLMAAAAPVYPEAETLLNFKESLSNEAALSDWNASVSLCTGNVANWNGLLCSNGTFYGLQLEGMGLGGTIDARALAKLPNLRSVSFKNNSFGGPLPELSLLGGALRGLFLSNNRFSGDIPDNAFSGMKSLRNVYLDNNMFTGKIPNTLAQIPKLAELWLADNQFEGEIPEFSSTDLRNVSFANNKLRGPIPASLSNVSAASFSGNSGLCGKPLAPCNSPKKKSSRKLRI